MGMYDSPIPLQKQVTAKLEDGSKRNGTLVGYYAFMYKCFRVKFGEDDFGMFARGYVTLA